MTRCRAAFAPVRVLAAGVLAVASVGVVACASGPASVPDSGSVMGRLPAGTPVDYQLGGAYPPDPRVGIVARDRTAAPADGVYSICYLNAFQTQPSERDEWADDLVLRQNGADLMDPDWPDEALLDTRSDDAREAIAARVGEWIDGCAAAGYAAVEFDNLDTYTRSDGLLSADDNLALATLLVERAHRAGLAAGQKNAAEDAERLRAEAGFDFAVVEECAYYDECTAYTDVYGDAVVAIEYTDAIDRPFDELCADPAVPASLVLRDRDLTMPRDADYAFEICPL
ncbi:endo alpha-1,4 polygalactosaminidase [Microbacterium sp. CIAB417]|uniref:endo alpha-1,4 polygalactosaminidase n=1 Tax=Microbacterium sp. CIAB417 TaxID=2860287 RepID=UPI001FABA9ED|nr:endo alpha-1,4 polygalactosaminidase [Microbacterium sp. CIAB417]